MIFAFEKGYICCGCRKRFKKADTYAVYKTSCLCRNCYSKFDQFSEQAVFPAKTGTDGLISAFYYKGLYRDVFLDFKFRGNESYGHLLGMAAAEHFKKLPWFGDYDCIVPVPLSKKRMSQRGFNQTEIMTRYVAEAVGLPIEHLLIRVKNEKPQSSEQPMKRYSNIKGSFAVSGDTAGKRILLADDIYTTGSTSGECAGVLFESGSGRIGIMSMAYTYHMNRFDYSTDY